VKTETQLTRMSPPMRSRWIERRATRALELEGSERVLVIGFGKGGGVRRLMRRLPWGYVSGVDPSAAMVRRAKRRNRRFMRGGLVDLRLGNASHLPWPDATFDAVVAVNATELSEAKRVLKDDGCISIALQGAPERGDQIVKKLWHSGFVCVRSRVGRAKAVYATALAA